MIKLYTWGTPNGRKISIALEELDLPYDVVPVDIGKGEQFDKEFLRISPNNKIPAILDGDFALFESGAILLYLAEKTGRLLPNHGTPEYWRVMQWLMWQMGNFGPLLGQAHHFLKYNPGKSEYAEARYHGEALRMYRVLDARLENREFVCDSFSIADIAIWCWASRYEYQRIELDDFPAVCRWYRQLAGRPGFQRGFAVPNGESIPIP
ncbi:MAG: glutathione S-transferase [Woeseiaceae bacterium]|nr:glutathione S-transferase [Woeseiaceae bacterium]NIP21097.1 glutathione S-transferase [Woeseiaceae bacterium]NIS90069.1 glutathione S-transferase [Woeseiaceae bacterium]